MHDMQCRILWEWIGETTFFPVLRNSKYLNAALCKVLRYSRFKRCIVKTFYSIELCIFQIRCKIYQVFWLFMLLKNLLTLKWIKLNVSENLKK